MCEAFQWFPYSQICSKVSIFGGDLASTNVSTESASLGYQSDNASHTGECREANARRQSVNQLPPKERPMISAKSSHDLTNQSNSLFEVREPWEPVVIVRQRRLKCHNARSRVDLVSQVEIGNLLGFVEACRGADQSSLANAMDNTIIRTFVLSNATELMQSRASSAISEAYEAADAEFQRAFNAAVLGAIPELTFRRWGSSAVLKLLWALPKHGDASVLNVIESMALAPGGAVKMGMSNAASRVLETFIESCSAPVFFQLAMTILREPQCVSLMTSSPLASHPFTTTMRRLRQEASSGKREAKTLARNYRHLLSALCRDKCSFASRALSVLRKAA
jgi:hypothetical protein